MPDLLISQAAILSVDPNVGDFDRADILVRDDMIVAVGRDLSTRPDATVIDATGLIAIPGFVDSHVHAWEGQLRGTAPVADFGEYLGLTAFGFGPHYRPSDNYAGTLLTALTALDAGITTIIDNSHNSLTRDHSVAAIEGLRDSGIRGVHAVGSPFGVELDHVPATAVALRDRFAGDRLSVRLFDINPAEQLWRFAKDEQLWVSTELGPHTPDLARTLEVLSKAGLFTPEHALNHCYDLAESTWQIIADSGAAVNLCPRSDAAFGLGSTVPPVAQALRYAAAVGLSNDNETSYGINMFAEMQALLLRHRSDGFRRRSAGQDAVVDDLTPSALLRMATQGGAHNAGLGDRIGSLTPGKQADVVLLRANAINTIPAADTLSTVTAIAHPGMIDTVMVGGRLRKQHGRLIGVDLEAVHSLVSASRAHLLHQRAS